MKKIYLILATASLAPALGFAQSATDAYNLSQYQLRGTARFMSMAGAFGALGGDLSSLSQNPAGIGVYRSHELGFTLDIDVLNSKTEGLGFSSTDRNTKFYLNNIGGVATIKLGNDYLPNINVGFTYNKGANFARRYNGYLPNINYSLSNYIAGVANNYSLTEADLHASGNYDPYDNGNIPPIAVLGYDSYLITPEGAKDNPHWYGQFGNGTTGRAGFNVEEKGSLDEYNIVLGGNINNVVYWGMNFDITSIDYRISSSWGESLDKAYVFDESTGKLGRTWSDFTLHNNYKVNGTGFNYQLGVIVKPIQELRLGLAFHTPTYYNLTETFYNERIDYASGFQKGDAVTYNGEPGYNDISFRSPWKVIASVAGVIGKSFILSADYEWQGMKHMEYAAAGGGGGWYDYPWYDDPWYDDPWYKNGANGMSKAPGVTPADYTYDSDPIGYTNRSISRIYQNTNTIRVGAEYRVLPQLSLRAGYSYTSSPVTSKAKDRITEVPGAGTMTNYRLDNATNYITAGIGYRHKGFYADLAYVYKHQTSDYYPFSPDPEDPMGAPNSKLTFDNSQIVMSFGIKF